MNKIFRHKKVVLLTGIMVIISFLIAAISILMIYNNAQKQSYDRLRDIVNREKAGIEVWINQPDISEHDIIKYLQQVRKNDISIGENGEIVFASAISDSIQFLISDKLTNEYPKISINIPIATPMRKALNRESGFIQEKDYNGIEVFAAYTFVEKLNWGIVAKIPTSEINKPFIKAIIWIFILLFILISIFTYTLLRITNPLFDKTIANEQKLIAINKTLNDKIEDLNLTRKKLEVNEKDLSLKNEEYEIINEKLLQTNEQLYIAKEKAEESETQLKELNATRDKLFSIIAHDLRSPFSSILGFSEKLIENIKKLEDAKVEKYLGIISLSAKNTLVLLDNLLNWAKSQTGQIKYKPEKTDLTSIIQEIIDISNPIAKFKNITLNRINSDNYEVYADQNMLKTVLRNLISNAIKFTKPGGNVNVFTISKQNQIEISISDNGVGMDDETCKKLFNISANITSVGTANEKGSGLGLVLCKEFVEKLGGNIWVESEKGKGSEFKFTLPLNKS